MESREHIEYSNKQKIEAYESKTGLIGAVPLKLKEVGGKVSVTNWGDKKATSLKIPDFVNIIGYRAFSSHTQLLNVDLPNNIEKIGELAFYNCSNLESIEIPKTVTSIGYKAFAKCSSLKKIEFNGNNLSLDGHVFEECQGLEEITFNVDTLDISIGQFMGCNNLKKVILNCKSVKSPADIVAYTNAKLEVKQPVVIRKID